MDMLWLVACAAAAFAGMTASCFASRLQRRRFGLPPLSPRRVRLHALVIAGMAALSLYAAWSRDGAAFGLMLWLGMTCTLGLTLVVALPFAPRLLRKIGVLFGCAAMAVSVVAVNST